MPDIQCPECGQVAHLVAIRKAAEEFCTKCDYPLFWAPSAVPMATPGSSNMATMRRLPGAGGRQRVGSQVCPECGELNPLGDEHTHCIRCSAELRPRPPAPTPEPIQVVEAQPLLPEPEPDKPWWPWPVIGGVVLVQLILLIIALN